ncbi:hypothetical protein VP01_618g2 [Puccinia sorghi]|uniref:Uncharacterized protein n=1 Tax=Puccinia sorghi TaxID=27349 RepID=A0A0L6UHK1_9BASI|nr:hypothetical protein VP01_618g2 [Puccinia sorghi]
MISHMWLKQGIQVTGRVEKAQKIFKNYIEFSQKTSKKYFYFYFLTIILSILNHNTFLLHYHYLVNLLVKIVEATLQKLKKPTQLSPTIKICSATWISTNLRVKFMILIHRWQVVLSNTHPQPHNRAWKANQISPASQSSFCSSSEDEPLPLRLSPKPPIAPPTILLIQPQAHLYICIKYSRGTIIFACCTAHCWKSMSVRISHQPRRSTNKMVCVCVGCEVMRAWWLWLCLLLPPAPSPKASRPETTSLTLPWPLFITQHNLEVEDGLKLQVKPILMASDHSAEVPRVAKSRNRVPALHMAPSTATVVLSGIVKLRRSKAEPCMLTGRCTGKLNLSRSAPSASMPRRLAGPHYVVLKHSLDSAQCHRSPKHHCATS